MNIIDFIQQFPDENACRVRCKKHRDKTCITCDKCNCTGHYWCENKLCYVSKMNAVTN